MSCDFEVGSNGLAVITLDRPPVNAIDDGVLDFMSSALQELEKRQDVGALLVRAEGRLFSAGADMKQIDAWGTGDVATEKLVVFSARLQDTFLRVARLPYPSVAAVHSTAAGAGLELALACDLRVLAHDAKVGLPEVRFGWIASAGGTQRLTARVGRSSALRVMLTEEFIDGDDAYRLGLADWVSDADQVGDEALRIATRIAGHPRAAVRAIKDLVVAGEGDGFARELYYTRTLEYEQESKGLVSDFLDKR